MDSDNFVEQMLNQFLTLEEDGRNHIIQRQLLDSIPTFICTAPNAAYMFSWFNELLNLWKAQKIRCRGVLLAFDIIQVILMKNPQFFINSQILCDLNIQFINCFETGRFDDQKLLLKSFIQLQKTYMENEETAFIIKKTEPWYLMWNLITEHDDLEYAREITFKFFRNLFFLSEDKDLLNEILLHINPSLVTDSLDSKELISCLRTMFSILKRCYGKGKSEKMYNLLVNDEKNEIKLLEHLSNCSNSITLEFISRNLLLHYLIAYEYNYCIVNENMMIFEKENIEDTSFNPTFDKILTLLNKLMERNAIDIVDDICTKSLTFIRVSERTSPHMFSLLRIKLFPVSLCISVIVDEKLAAFPIDDYSIPFHNTEINDFLKKYAAAPISRNCLIKLVNNFTLTLFLKSFLLLSTTAKEYFIRLIINTLENFEDDEKSKILITPLMSLLRNMIQMLQQICKYESEITYGCVAKFGFNMLNKSILKCIPLITSIFNLLLKVFEVQGVAIFHMLKLDFLTQTLLKRLNNEYWEIRDSSLELIIAILCVRDKQEVDELYDKRLAFSKLVYERVEILTHDFSANVRSTAFKVMQTMASYNNIWDELLAPNKSLEGIIATFKTEPDGNTRMNIINTITHIYRNNRICECEMEPVYQIMYDVACKDVHSPVVLSMLVFWTSCLNNEYFKINFEVQDPRDGILKFLRDLSSHGFAQILHETIENPCDFTVETESLNIVTKLINHLHHHGVILPAPEVQQNADPAEITINYDGGQVPIDRGAIRYVITDYVGVTNDQENEQMDEKNMPQIETENTPVVSDKDRDAVIDSIINQTDEELIDRMGAVENHDANVINNYKETKIRVIPVNHFIAYLIGDEMQQRIRIAQGRDQRLAYNNYVNARNMYEYNQQVAQVRQARPMFDDIDGLDCY